MEAEQEAFLKNKTLFIHYILIILFISSCVEHINRLYKDSQEKGIYHNSTIVNDINNKKTFKPLLLDK
jgi:hypothetical protein